MITKDDLDQLFEWGSSVEFPLKISPKFTGRGKDFDGDDWRGYWLKMTRRMTNIRKSYMPEHIVKIHENPDILRYPYKRIQIPLSIPDNNICYMEWTDSGARIIWEEGQPQVCEVMNYTHHAFNKSDKPMDFLFVDVKLDTEVMINN